MVLSGHSYESYMVSHFVHSFVCILQQQVTHMRATWCHILFIHSLHSATTGHSYESYMASHFVRSFVAFCNNNNNRDFGDKFCQASLVHQAPPVVVVRAWAGWGAWALFFCFFRVYIFGASHVMNCDWCISTDPPLPSYYY